MLFEKVERGCQKNKFVKYVDIKKERGCPSINLRNSPFKNPPAAVGWPLGGRSGL